jgi:hypothetical protein
LIYTRIQIGIILFYLLIEVIWIKISSFSVNYSKEQFYVVVICYPLIGFLYLFYKKFRPDPIIIPLLQTACFLLLYFPLILGFSYLGATTNLPFVDSSLDSVDRYFGIYTPSIVFWFRNHEWLEIVFTFIYDLFFLQFLFIIFYFSFLRRPNILQRFLIQFVIASFLSILISIFYPAAGPYSWYDYTTSPELSKTLNHLLQLRDHVFDVTSGEGIIMVPSFHSVMALIYTYTFRNEKKIIFIPILILNILLIFSCIPIGGHYFADILAAIPVFLVTVWIESLIFKAVQNS